MSLTIADAIPSAVPLVTLGTGMMVANALMAAGQKDTSMVLVDPTYGKPSLDQTAEELIVAQALDRDMKLERANKPIAPQMTIGTTGPGMGGPA